MSLSKINEFERFKQEMKYWDKQKPKKKVSAVTYIGIMLMSFLTLVSIGVLIERQKEEEIRSNSIYSDNGEIFDITQYGDFSEEFIDKYVNKESNFIIEDIDSIYLEEDDLIDFTKSELALIRNEIYARHGYSYYNEPYMTYFNNKEWYYGYREEIGYEELSLEEQSNINLIRSLEERNNS
ncbi:MAG: YARHG domain-containing protein [Paraclostridium sp.]